MAEYEGELCACLDRAVEESEVGVAQTTPGDLDENFARLRRSPGFFNALKRPARFDQAPRVSVDALLH
jgi:hypothetical protein